MDGSVDCCGVRCYEEADYEEAANIENNSDYKHFVYPGDIDRDRINTNARTSSRYFFGFMLRYNLVLWTINNPHNLYIFELLQ